MYSIKHLFHINTPKEKVFEAVSTIKGLAGWWTVKTSGSDAFGGILYFHFGEMEGPQMKVIELKPNEKVSWECVKSPFGWDGHIFTFCWMKTMERPESVSHRMAGLSRMIFTPVAVSAGEDIWKACGSFAKPGRVKHLEARGTGNSD